MTALTMIGRRTEGRGGAGADRDERGAGQGDAGVVGTAGVPGQYGLSHAGVFAYAG